MKFTKEELAEKLQGKLTRNGRKTAYTERTIQSFIEMTYAIGEIENIDEIEVDDFVAVVMSGAESLEGQMRHTISDSIKNYKEQWEREHPTPATEQKDKGSEDVPEWAKALIESNKAMKERLDAQDNEKAVGEKRRLLAEALRDKGVKNEKYIDGYIARASLTKDTDIEAEAKKAVEWYNEVNSTIEPSRTPRKSGGTTPEDGHEFDDLVANKKKNKNE